MQFLRVIHRYWIAIIFVAVLVQIGAAGYGAFNASVKTDDNGTLTENQLSSGFDFHNSLGYALFLAGILLLLLALGARLGRGRVGMSLVLALLLFVQILLAVAGESTQWVGIFHPLNAFLILGLAGRLSYEAWRGSPRTAAAP